MRNGKKPLCVRMGNVKIRKQMGALIICNFIRNADKRERENNSHNLKNDRNVLHLEFFSPSCF
jgi:hypothetical protein